MIIMMTLTILTDALRNAVFSSCSCFTRRRNVSTSILNTRISWRSESIRFWNCSRVKGLGATMRPSTELESDSLALSAMTAGAFAPSTRCEQQQQ